MSEDLRGYTGATLDVFYDKAKCIHAGECGRGLRAVFDGRRTPWIEVDRAPADEVIRVVERCPTGALTYARKDGGPVEAAGTANVVQVSAHGPLYARGDVTLKRADGSETTVHRVALCRCGHSKNKPFCDDSHVAANFRDAGAIASDASGPPPAAGKLTVTVAPNGPLLLAGPVCVRTASGRDAVHGDRAALCRCGHSENKPFCDGTHRKVGFTAE